MLVSKTRNDPHLTEPLVPLPKDGTYLAAKDRGTEAQALFQMPEKKIDAEGNPIELEAPNDFETEDVVSQAAMMEAVGAGLSRQEMYGVAMAIKKLGEDPNIKINTVRFFGKLLGTHADYYVFETTLKEPGESAVDDQWHGTEPPGEAAGTGANTYTYYVCSYLGGAFRKLPDVTPQQIKVARQIKKFLTGSLEAPVSAYPPFPGNEANYLRAQIARIACSTVLCPNGMFSVGEDEVSVERVEDFAASDAATMRETTSWAHRYPYLRKQGRCVAAKREAPEGEEDNFQLTPEEEEEGPALLTTVDQDVEVVGGGPAWTAVTSSALETTKFPVTAMRSNVWPGAYSIVKGAEFTNVYVGYGIKNAPFVPLPPPAVAKVRGSAPSPALAVPAMSHSRVLFAMPPSGVRHGPDGEHGPAPQAQAGRGGRGGERRGGRGVEEHLTREDPKSPPSVTERIIMVEPSSLKMTKHIVKCKGRAGSFPFSVPFHDQAYSRSGDASPRISGKSAREAAFLHIPSIKMFALRVQRLTVSRNTTRFAANRDIVACWRRLPPGRHQAAIPPP